MAKSNSPGSPGFSYKPEHPDQTPPKLADIQAPKGYKVKPMTRAERQQLAELQKAQKAKK